MSKFGNGFLADRANAAYAGIAAKHMATADEIAQVIYDAVTDGTNRLRYFCGGDTGNMVNARRELPEEKILKFMRAQFSTLAKTLDA